MKGGLYRPHEKIGGVDKACFSNADWDVSFAYFREVIRNDFRSSLSVSCRC